MDLILWRKCYGKVDARCQDLGIGLFGQLYGCKPTHQGQISIMYPNDENGYIPPVGIDYE